RYLAFLATAPVAIPGIVLAVGLFLSYTTPPLVLYGTLAIIFLAYLTKELPVGYQQVAASLRSVHPELEDASRIFGATRLRALADGRLKDAARILVVGDSRVLEQGAKDAGVALKARTYRDPESVDWTRDEIAIVDLGNIDPALIERGKVSAESGRLTGETLA